MKKLSRSLMLTLMTVCLAVCCLFAGCSKHAGTYTGVTVLTQKQIELKLKGGDEFELTVDSSSTKGTWSVDEEDENSIKLVFDSGEGVATVEGDYLVIAYVGLNSTAVSASGAKLYKK